MSELDELERDLRIAGDIWLRDDLLLKLERLIVIAREGEAAKRALADHSHGTLRPVEFERERVRT